METSNNDSERAAERAGQIAGEISEAIWELRKLHQKQVELSESYADRRFELLEATAEARTNEIGQFIVDFTTSPQVVVEGVPGTGKVVTSEAYHFIVDSDGFETWGVGVNSGQILLRNRADDTWVAMDSGVGFEIRPYVPEETTPLEEHSPTTAA